MAEVALRSSADIHEGLFVANPGDVEIKAGFAGSLCRVGRWDEAERLIDQVLDVLPLHPYANELKRFIRSQRGS